MPLDLAATTTNIFAEQPVVDMHTHCYPAGFGHSGDGTGKGLLLWGINELLTYHYLVAEVFRIVPATELPYEKFWQMSKAEQADHIWKHLFVDRTPLSEACRGVLTTLETLGLDPNERSLEGHRKWFAEQDADSYIDTVMDIAGVQSITMTNEVFDPYERSLWLTSPEKLRDPRFQAVLRIDMLLCDWPGAVGVLSELGYEVREDFSGRTVSEARRFLSDWIGRMDAIYVAMSLPPDFSYPASGNESVNRVVRDIMMPTLEEHGLACAMMIGATRGTNPGLGTGSDTLGKADVTAVANLCREFPNNKFFITMLSRENQHELCVIARKFGNLMLFGCWWFLNNPSIITEMTRERLELLGTSFIPQHSDARVLDQLIYKWTHSRALIADCLTEQYNQLAVAGYEVSEEQILGDADRLLRTNFETFRSATPVAVATA